MIESARPSLDRLTFEEAWLYCATLEHNGHYDWRMPTYTERINLRCFGTWNMILQWKYEGLMKDKMRVAPVRDI